VPLDVAKSTAKDCFPITRPTNQSPVFFVKLLLRQGEQIVSDNFYWGCAKGGSCEALNELPRVKITARAAQLRNHHERKLSVRVANPTASVALAIRLKVQRAKSGERVLPVFYSDNYFSLLPGESRTIAATFDEANLAGDVPKLVVEGWNIQPQEIRIK
jgi:hypothetical protein